MKRITVLITLLITLLLNSYGQTLSDAIKSMPEDIIWGLTTEQKDEILANQTDSIVTVSGNSLYNKYIRENISDTFISIQTSDAGNVQIKLLPLINNTNIICVVKTVCKDFCDSNISFYTQDWTEIKDKSLFPTPELSWFIKSNIEKHSDEYKNAIAVVDILPIKLSLSPNSNSIQIELNIEKYLDEKNYTTLTAFLQDSPKELKWDKTKFE